MYFRQSDWRNNHHGMYNSEEMMVKKYFHTNPEGDMDNLMNCLLQNPMPLRKNLADTIIVTKEKQKKKTMLNVDTSPPKLNSNTTNGSSPTAPVMAGYMPYFRVPNIVSNLFNAVKGAVSAHWRTKSPQHDESSHQMSPPTWQSANGEVQNKSAPDSHSNSKSDMNIDCRLAAEQCEKKLCQLTSLLPSKPLESGKFHRRRPKKQFVEPDSVEEQFEDALSPEDVATLKLANDAHFGCQTVYQVHEGELFETASPNIKIETKHLEDMDIIKTVPVVEDKDLNSVNSDINLEKVTNTDIVLENCVDLVQEDKGERSVPSNENKCSKLTNLIEIPFDNQDTGLKSSFKHHQPSKHIVHSPTKDKHYKNPNRTTDKRKKCKQRMSIQDDLVFANEIASEDMSSVENSPSIRHFDKLYKKHAASSPITIRDAPMDSFNEISGRFNSTSSTNSDEAFQIVFNDSPKESRLRQLSDCDSEDSFIVFDDSPDGCYTTNDVFSDSDESFSDSSDSETELSDTHEVPIRTLSHYTKTCSDLTNDSLYVDKPMDVVDCAVRNVSEDKPRDLCGVQKAVEGESSGVLLNDSRKLIRRSQPQKKVHFSSKPPKVHVMRVWAFAARQARAGHWERCVIDRERFKRRIADVDLAVSWVLKPQHRSRVMFQRFMPWWNAQKRKELAEKRAKEEEDKAKLEMAEKSVDGNVNSARENNENTVGINDNASLDNENAKNANNRLAPADVAKLNKVNGINVDCNKDAVNGNDGKRNLNDNNLTDLDTLDALNVNDTSQSALNCNLSTAPVNGKIDNLPRAT